MTDNEMVEKMIAKLRELKAVQTRYLEVYNEDEVAMTLIAKNLNAWLAIQDVLAIPSYSIDILEGADNRTVISYNFALAEIRLTITNRLGGMK